MDSDSVMRSGDCLPDVIAFSRALWRHDEEAMAAIFNEYAFDVRAGAFVGELCGVFLGLADSLPDDTVDGLLTRLYESALSERYGRASHRRRDGLLGLAVTA